MRLNMTRREVVFDQRNGIAEGKYEGGVRNNLNEGANSTYDSVNSEQLLDLDAQPPEMQRHIQEGREGASLRIPLSSCPEEFFPPLPALQGG